MFHELKKVQTRPQPFERYTAPRLWTDPYISKKMLEFHLSSDSDLASRRPDFVERSIEWIADRFKINEGKSVADFGCGPGLYTNRFAEIGGVVTGIDFSENSLVYAKKVAFEKGVSLNYIPGNYLDFSSDETFDLITMIYCDFSALSPAQRKTLLNIFRRHLKEGGSVLLDVFSGSFFRTVKEEVSFSFVPENGFWASGPHFVFNHVYKYTEESIYLGKFNIYEEFRENEVYNWLQCFTPETLRQEFAESGFEIEEIFSNVAGDSYNPDSTEIALIAKKID